MGIISKNRGGARLRRFLAALYKKPYIRRAEKESAAEQFRGASVIRAGFFYFVLNVA